jgi:natural product precursor
VGGRSYAIYKFKVMIEKKKTLSFQKETISNLSSNEMKNLKGGSSNICWGIGGWITGHVLDELIPIYLEATKGWNRPTGGGGCS